MQLTQNEKKDLINCNSCYLLGTLATSSSAYPGMGETNEPVTVMKGSSKIIFYIRPLSDEPSPINYYINTYTPTEPLYIGLDTHQNQVLLPIDYKYILDTNKKIKIIEEKLNNKLILFKPIISFKADGQVFKNLEIVAIEDDIEIGTNKQFISVPKINMDNETFEQKLLEGSNIKMEDYSHLMLMPEFVLCSNYLYSNFKSWDKHSENNKMWSCSKEQNKIKRIKFDFEESDTKNMTIRVTDNLIFVDYDYLQQIVSPKIDKEGQLINAPIQKNTNELQESSVENKIDSDKEMEFLDDLKQYTKEIHLCYAEKDLYNFHISIKTNPITIVAGMSGTGKTQIARAYAKVMGLSEEDGNLLFLPISPSYTEPEDLLGYLNTSNGLYMTTETGLTDFLINAERNPDKMHMVIFDEMNLSQVEYWFAPFISLLELESDARKLRLYSSKNTICHNSERYKPTVHIGNNILFIGTVNLDETTKDFSDRLLDRANIVTLKKQSFESLRNEQEQKNPNSYIIKSYSFSEYSSWIKEQQNISKVFTKEEVVFLDELHLLIQKYDDQKGVSFRIFEKLGSYLMNIPKDASEAQIISRREAFDIQIKQRLMTKIKGTERQFGGLIGSMKGELEIPQNSELYDFFNNEKAKSISDFDLVKREIKRKARELSLYGYAN